MLSFLGELSEAGTVASSLYLPPGISTADVGTSLGAVVDITEVVDNLIEPVAKSETGAVVFWGKERKCLIIPPFPVKEKRVSAGYDIESLRFLLSMELTIALVLVRLGSYAIGVCRDEKLIASKVGTGLVHARHRQGGSSQGRFARHREKQIESFLGRVCEHVREKLEPHARTIDYIVYGGAWTTILALQKRCPFLAQFDDRRLPPLLSVPEPRQAVLESAVGDVWSSGVTEWREQPVD